MKWFFQGPISKGNLVAWFNFVNPFSAYAMLLMARALQPFLPLRLRTCGTNSHRHIPAPRQYASEQHWSNQSMLWIMHHHHQGALQGCRDACDKTNRDGFLCVGDIKRRIFGNPFCLGELLVVSAMLLHTFFRDFNVSPFLDSSNLDPHERIRPAAQTGFV